MIYFNLLHSSIHRKNFRLLETDLEFNKIKRQLYRIKNSKYPKIPRTIGEIKEVYEEANILEKFGRNLDETHELYVGTVEKATYSFTVFVSHKTIDLVEKNIPPSHRKYLIDGTFKIVPSQFYQLMIISIQFANDVSD